MSEEVNIDATVDELSKPGNEAALSDALTNAFQNVDADSAAKPEAGQNKGNDNGNNGSDADDAAGSSKEENGSGDGSGNDSWPDILADRNAKKEAGANDQIQKTALEQRIENLTKLVEELKGKGGQANDDVDGDGAAEDKPLTMANVMEAVKKVLGETKQAEAEQLASEKSDADEVNKILSDKKLGKLAKPYEAKLKEFVSKHKSVSGFAALCAVVGAEALQERLSGKPSFNKTAVGNRGKANLHKDKNPKDMSSSDIEAYLRKEQAEGRLTI